MNSFSSNKTICVCSVIQHLFCGHEIKSTFELLYRIKTLVFKFKMTNLVFFAKKNNKSYFENNATK